MPKAASDVAVPQMGTAAPPGAQSADGTSGVPGAASGQEGRALPAAFDTGFQEMTDASGNVPAYGQMFGTFHCSKGNAWVLKWLVEHQPLSCF